MKIGFSLSILITIMLCAQAHSAQTRIDIKPVSPGRTPVPRYGCLPPDVEANAIVEVKTIRSRVGIRMVKETVAQRLNKLGARCRVGKLVDRNGRGIRFHRLQGCWGNPPADYLEILQNEKRELRELKRKFTVVEITCNTTGLMPY